MCFAESAWKPAGLPVAVIAAFACLVAPPTRADEAYFIQPSGTVWSVLLDTDATATSVAAFDGGYVVSGFHSVTAGPPIDSFAVLARLDTGGNVVKHTNFFAEGEHNWAREVIPRYGGDGTLDGFAFTGSKYREDGVYHVPWMWLVKTDTSLVKQEEALFGAVSHHTEGRAIFEEPSGFLLGGRNYFTAGMSGSDEWLVRTDPSGVMTSEQYFYTGNDSAVYSIAPVPGGGYVLGTSHGIVKIGSDLEVEWRTGTGSYTAVEPTADGQYFYGVSGTRLTRLTADGSNDWTRAIGYGAVDIGRDLVLAPDGGCVVVGSAHSHDVGGGDLWVLKTDADGVREWDLWLGGEASDGANSVALAEDGNYLVAGWATLDDESRMWVVKVRHDLHAPEASFTYSPPSPVFRDQEVTFDASASTAPESYITGYAWDYGDGGTNVGVTNQYAFHGAGTFDVILEVENADGVLGFATQAVEVTGLELQWRRTLGARNTDTIKDMILTRDGGYMMVGTKPGNNTDLWIIRTDHRGKNEIERRDYASDQNDPEGAWSIIHAHDDGYIAAGYISSNREESAWLLKVDEQADPVWSSLIGETGRVDRAYSVAATPDGGYVVGGYHKIPNEATIPSLTWTDALGNEFRTVNYDYPENHAAVRSVVATSNACGLAINYNEAGTGGPTLAVETGVDGGVVWSNLFTGHRPFTATEILPRTQEPGGYVLVGQANERAAMEVLDRDGASIGGGRWNILPNERDRAESVVPTLDGGYLTVGTIGVGGGHYNDEVALIKTDDLGNTHWVDTYPGNTNRSEFGIDAVALDDGSYVVVAERFVGEFEAPIWLFRLAANRVPTAALVHTNGLLHKGQSVAWDGTPSTDVDGSVMLYEWDFGDGTTNSGAMVTNTFPESGQYHVILTAVDDDYGEGYFTNTVYVLGVVMLNTNGLILTGTSVTNNPGEDSEHYPRQGADPRIDWERALGFRVSVEPDSSSTSRAIQATFSKPIPPGYVMYYSANGSAWAPISYTLINERTVEVWRINSNYVPIQWSFLLAPLYPVPEVTHAAVLDPPRFSVTFDAYSGVTYRVQKALGLVEDDWTNTLFAPAPAAAATLESLTGTGGTEIIYLDAYPEDRGYFRPVMELPEE